MLWDGERGETDEAYAPCEWSSYAAHNVSPLWSAVHPSHERSFLARRAHPSEKGNMPARAATAVIAQQLHLDEWKESFCELGWNDGMLRDRLRTSPETEPEDAVPQMHATAVSLLIRRRTSRNS